MKTMIVTLPEKEELFFSTLLKKFHFKSRVLSEEEKEDSALIALMYERENEETVSVKTTHRILDKIIKK
jgi:hypothetical protein